MRTSIPTAERYGDTVWYDCDMIIGIDTSRAFVSDKTGTENYSYHLVKHLLRLPESQQHIFVLFIRPNAIIPDWVIKKNVQIKLVKYRILWTQIGLAAQTWRRAAVTQLHGDTVPQYLHVLWVPAHTLPVLRNPRTKTIVTIHGLEYVWLKEYANLLQRWYLPLSTRYAAYAADQLIAVSHFTRQQLIKELHTNPQKIKVVHEGVRLSSRKAAPAGLTSVLNRYGLQNKKYLLFVGTVQPRKNLEKLVEAFSIVAQEYPEYKLVIAGGIGWMADAILRSPSRFSVPEKVVLTGRIDQITLEDLYLGACLYVQPSITEGFGLPILEAMARGVPVISSDGGALSEIVGRAGVIVQLSADFAHTLARAIKQLLNNPMRQNQLISMGYNRASYFSWDKTARETLKVLLG